MICSIRPDDRGEEVDTKRSFSNFFRMQVDGNETILICKQIWWNA